MRSFHLTLIMCVLLAFSLRGVAQELTPHQVVIASSDKVLFAIREGQKQDIGTEELGNTLLELLEPVVDFDGIAKAVMGKHYKAANIDQRQEFAVIFRNTMAKLYAKSLLKFGVEDITVLQDEPLEPFKGKVMMRVTTSDQSEYAIVYSMRRNKADEWQVRNVILDGINMGLTYRNQFDSAMNRHQGDVSKVINGWVNEINSQ